MFQMTLWEVVNFRVNLWNLDVGAGTFLPYFGVHRSWLWMRYGGAIAERERESTIGLGV